MLTFSEKKFSQVAAYQSSEDPTLTAKIRVHQESEDGPVVSADQGYVMKDGNSIGYFSFSLSPDGEVSGINTQAGVIDNSLLVAKAAQELITEIKQQLTFKGSK